jgi:hypothetical protein
MAEDQDSLARAKDMFARHGITVTERDLELIPVFLERLRPVPAPKTATEPWLVPNEGRWPRD